MSMNSLLARRKSSLTSTCSSPPRRSAGGPGSPAVTMSRISPMPESPDSASAPRRTSFAPV